jgi:hypothetical protein
MLATVAHEKSHLVIGDMSAGQRNGPLQREVRSITQPPLRLVILIDDVDGLSSTASSAKAWSQERHKEGDRP